MGAFLIAMFIFIGSDGELDRAAVRFLVPNMEICQHLLEMPEAISFNFGNLKVVNMAKTCMPVEMGKPI